MTGINKDSQAFPNSHPTCPTDGMTLRQYYAINAPEMNKATAEQSEALLGEKFNIDWDLETQAKYWFRVDVKLRFLFADTMLAHEAKEG